MLLQNYGIVISKKLNNLKLIEKIMVNAALEAGAEIREVAFHKFCTDGSKWSSNYI